MRDGPVGELHWLSVAEAAQAIADKELSPVELMKALLERIATLDPRLNAFIKLDAEAAMAAAKAAEAEAVAGRLRGPLHGVPVGIKDIINVAGLATTCHSKILTDNIAKADAVCVQKLRGAGAIVMGKLSTHEFAIGGPSFDLPWPPARNPWNTDHHPGGSSSGSGSGVAAGLFPMALGTDTGGSVRNPASCCGIVGLKPTYGLVSRRGVFPLSFTLDHIGPMTRTVADNALMLQAIAGHDALDPGSAASVNGHYAANLDRGVRDLRIGFVRHFHEVDTPAEAEVTAALPMSRAPCRWRAPRCATSACRRSPSSARSTASSCKARPGRSTVPWLRERPGDYGQLSRRRLMAGAFMNAGDYVQAQRRRLEMIAEVEAAFRQVDVLLVRQLDGPALPHRPAGRPRPHLSAPGAHAVQRHRPSRARHAGRAVGRRPALVGAVRRPLLRGKHPVPGGARLGARGGHGQEAPGDRVKEKTNSLN